MTTAEPNKAEPSTISQTVGVAVPSYPHLLQGVTQATNQLLTKNDYPTSNQPNISHPGTSNKRGASIHL